MSTESRTYYYARVSSKEQNLDRQLAAFASLGASEREIITDKQSGKDLARPGYMALRACLKSSNEDGNEGKNENLSRNKEFALTIFPKSAEFVEPAEKTLYHPAARQHNKLV